MLKRRLIAILVGLALIVAGAMRPMPARAQSVAEDFGIAMAALGAWIVVIVGGTLLVYGPPTSLSEEAKPDIGDLEAHHGVRFGPRCQTAPDAPPPLACW